MSNKRIIIAILLVGFLLPNCQTVFGQNTRPSLGVSRERAAQEKTRSGDYPAAIALYQEAINLEPSRREKERLQGELYKVKKRFYVDLYKRARRTSSSEEIIKLLTQAQSLDVENLGRESQRGLRKLGGVREKEFREAVLEVRVLRLKIFTELRKDATAAARKRDYDRAVTGLEQARKLDPKMFNQQRNLGTLFQKIKDRAKRGKEVALEGKKLVDQGKYQEAEEKFKTAEALYPGQKLVQEGLARIQSAQLQYEVVVAEADAAFNQGQLDDAMRSYQQAIGLAPKRAETDGIKVRLSKLKDAVDHLNKARNAFREGRFAEARSGFEKTLQLHPDSSEARQYLVRADSMALLLEGQRYSAENQFELAEKSFDRAVERYRRNGEAARLLEQSQNYSRHIKSGKASHRRGSCEQAQRQLLSARELDARRFKFDGLDRLLSQDCAPAAARVATARRRQADAIPLPVAQIRAGLIALFDGRVGESIEILEAVLDKVGGGHAQVHAFLGAAYCYAALVNPEPDTLSLDSAREQFGMALNLEPGYQLSEKLFSPRILRILEELRAQTP